MKRVTFILSVRMKKNKSPSLDERPFGVLSLKIKSRGNITVNDAAMPCLL